MAESSMSGKWSDFKGRLTMETDMGAIFLSLLSGEMWRLIEFTTDRVPFVAHLMNLHTRETIEGEVGSDVWRGFVEMEAKHGWPAPKDWANTQRVLDNAPID